jgi:sugar phosphate isomerase/epimerase
MSRLQDRLALHTWTLDTTPLADALRIAKQTGWNAVELRRVDFTRCLEAGMSNGEAIELVRASGIEVAILGAESGLLFAKTDELRRLLGVFTETCANAAALGCATVMLAPGQNVGTLREAAANCREAGAIAAKHGVRLALEFSSRHPVINSIAVAREILTLADHSSCGLLLDAYHLERTGSGGRGFEAVPASEIFAFQYSDVPPVPAGEQGPPTDRLPPGKGTVRWREVFGLLVEKGYSGYLSYEAPNPEHWSRPPGEVAREAANATRALLAAQM